MRLVASSNNFVFGNNVSDSGSYLAVGLSSGNNITGNEIGGPNSLGLGFSSSSNNTIMGNNIHGSDGLGLYNSSGNNIFRNNVTNNPMEGIRIIESSENTVLENSVVGSEVGIGLQNSLDTTISGNIVAGNIEGFRLYASSGNSMRDNIMANNSMTGISIVGFSSSSNISENVITNSNTAGILLSESGNNRITRNNITASYSGIYFDYSGSNNIVENMITGNEHGFALYASESNDIFNNYLSGNGYGLTFYASSGSNNIVGNSIMDSIVCGIFFDVGGSVDPSNSNVVFHNNFGNNTRQVYDIAWEHQEYLSSINIWDNGCEGNYWSDYNGRDPDHDGIGNTPYIIDGNNTDRYPLMNLYWIAADVNHDLKVDVLDVVVITGAYGATPSDPFWNPHADIAQPFEKIDILDIVLCTGHYGEKYP